ncbi:MAG: ATP-binding protein [Saprospiraceae bacterium]
MKAILIFVLLCCPAIVYGQPKQESLSLSILETGEHYITQNHPDSAVIFAQTILSRPKLDKITRCQALLVLGRGHYRSEDPDAAVLPLQKSLFIARSIKNEPLKLNALIALGASMLTKHYPQLDSALMYLEEAKPLAASLKDTLNQARVYNTLANLYLDEEDLETALVQCNLCESILKNDKFEAELGACYNTKGTILYELFYRDGKKDYLQSAIPYFQKAIAIFKNHGNKRFEANARMNMGMAFAFLDDYGRAEAETKMGIKLGEEIKDSAILLSGYYNLANHYEGENRMKEAKLALNEMNVLLEKNGTAADATFVTDQFSNSAIKVSTAFVKNRMDLIDKQLAIEKSAQENQLSWFISIVLALIAISALIYSYQKNKFNAQQKKLIQEELDNTLKTQKIAYMQARFEGEEEGRRRIAKQIHDGVGGLLVSAKWNLESALHDLSKKETKVAARLNNNLRLQEHSYRELRRVVHALQRADIPWWEDLQRVYLKMTEHSTTKIQFYTYNLDNRVRGLIGEEASLIVQESITNALKHSKATEISVQINQIEGVLGIIIEDNGIGFDPEKTEKGLGLHSIHERCTKLGGSLSFESREHRGTTIFVDIPVNNQDNLKEGTLLYAGSN